MATALAVPRITVKPQRDPIAWRAKRQQLRQRAIDKANQVTRCYEEHQPPQIRFAGDYSTPKGQVRPGMLRCHNVAGVSPRRGNKGTSCLTVFAGPH